MKNIINKNRSRLHYYERIKCPLLDRSTNDQIEYESRKYKNQTLF